MDFAEFANSLRIVDLTAKSRATAIRKLAQLTKLEDDGVSLDDLIEAIEEREATAQTVVAPGFAIPHAVTDWPGDFRVVLGRSRDGIDYETTESEPVSLTVLLVVGKRGRAGHLEYLSTLGEFFSEEAFRNELITASDTQAVGRLIKAKAGLVEQPKRGPRIPATNRVIVRQAITVASELSAQAILVAADSVDDIPWDSLLEWEGRLLVVTPDIAKELPVSRLNTHLLDVPRSSLSRTDRANLGLLLSSTKGLLTSDAEVVCVSGGPGRRLDSLILVRPEPNFKRMFGAGQNGKKRILPTVILRSITLALELAEEGREGKPIGAMFVIGDSRQVVRHTQQLVLNPFHGYSRSLRNILDPSLGETIKEFALLDGAFIIQADGMVLSAGTYVLPKVAASKLPSGLGTRHQAAASITAHTDAMTIAVSQSTGTVYVFRQGKPVLKLERSTPGRS